MDSHLVTNTYIIYNYVLQSIVYIIIADDDTSPGPSRKKLSTTTPRPTSDLAQLVVCVIEYVRKFWIAVYSPVWSGIYSLG